MTTEEKILNTTPSQDLTTKVSTNNKDSHDLRTQALKEIGLQIASGEYSRNFEDVFYHSQYDHLLSGKAFGVDRENGNFVMMTMCFETCNPEVYPFRIIQANQWSVEETKNCYFSIFPLKAAKSLGSKRSYHGVDSDKLIAQYF